MWLVFEARGMPEDTYMHKVQHLGVLARYAPRAL